MEEWSYAPCIQPRQGMCELSASLLWPLYSWSEWPCWVGWISQTIWTTKTRIPAIGGGGGLGPGLLTHSAAGIIMWDITSYFCLLVRLLLPPAPAHIDWSPAENTVPLLLCVCFIGASGGGGAGESAVLQNVQSGCGAHPVSYLMGTGVIFRG
jgi:hypothetical protein